MTAHNPDQDEFDPSLEEGHEDFNYDEESFGDEEFADDESWEENFDEAADAVEEEASAERPAKKKGGLFNVIVIALAILGGGGFIYMKVLAPQGAAPSQQQVPQDAAQNMADAGSALPTDNAPTDNLAANTHPDLPPQTDPTNSPLMPEPTLDAMPDAPPTLTADSGMPAPTEPTRESMPESTSEQPPALALTPEPTFESAPVAPVMEQPVEVASAPPMPAPIAAPESAPEAALKNNEGFNSGLPSARDIMIAPGEPAATQEAVQEPAPVVATVSTEQAGGLSADAVRSIEQKLSVLITRLDTFENRISTLESGLHQVSGKISSLESKPADTANLDSVHSAIKSLEQKISAVEKNASKRAETKSVSSEPARETTDVTKIDRPTFVPAAPEEDVSPVVTSAPKQETSAPKSVASESVRAEPATRSAAWILRSAQPGSAMVVAKSGGDIRTIRVGDSLAGLGRITAIEQRGSKWVVQGTQGTITH